MSVQKNVITNKNSAGQNNGLQLLFEQSPAFICTLRGPHHIFELANNRYLQLVGFRDIIGKTVAEALPEVIEQGFVSLLDHVYNSGESYVGTEVKVSLQRTKGAPLEERFINFVYQALQDEQRTVYGIFVHGVDVTEQMQIRKKLIESEQLFKSYTEAMPQMAFIADGTGNITFFNQRWYEYVGGITGTEGWGWKDRPIHHPDDLQRAIERWSLSLETGEPYEIEYRLRRYDGEYRWHLGRALPVRDEKGTIIQWLGTNTDIHEQKMAAQHKDDFLAIASHELKTPVTSVKAYAQVLARNFRSQGDTKTAVTVERLNSQIDRLTNLISDLLDVTKIQSGKLLFHSEMFEPTELFSEIIDEVQITTETHKIIKNFGKTERVLGDRERIGQVLTNLLTNAIKYSPESEKVVVTTVMKGNKLQVCVKDFGIGIPLEKQSEVFKQFFRVTEQLPTTLPGLGLGLYISKEIITRSGGEIWVESEEGMGATFCFTLPIAIDQH